MRADMVAPFQIDGVPVRGRVSRLAGESLDPILSRHAYPRELARLLGEALLLSVLVGDTLKFDGRLIVQAEGDGPVTMLVAEYARTGSLRGYARTDPSKWNALMARHDGTRPDTPELFGPRGALGLMIVDADPARTPYQGLVALEGATLAECAEGYFQRSEQVPTRIALGVGELEVAGRSPTWTGGGLLLQKVAGDTARGDSDEAWNTASALFTTVSDGELIDPELAPEGLLYRLFHEEGVRLEPPGRVRDACSCNEARLRATLANMPDAGLKDLVEPDGTLSIDCQFCNRHYTIPIGEVTGPGNA
jgi:molecular chaperone Hsp33